MKPSNNSLAGFGVELFRESVQETVAAEKVLLERLDESAPIIR